MYCRLSDFQQRGGYEDPCYYDAAYKPLSDILEIDVGRIYKGLERDYKQQQDIAHIELIKIRVKN